MSKEVKYNLLKRKLKELLQENSQLSEKLEAQGQKIKILKLEKDLLLERLAKDEEAAKEFLLTHSQAVKNPSEGSVTDVEMSLDLDIKHNGKEKKKKKKNTPKIKKIYPVVTGEDGNPIYPFKLGLITVENLGHIVYDRDTFHNERYIYPVGFRIKRDYWSTRDPEAVVTFTCEIKDGGTGPSFVVTPMDYPEDQVVSNSPTGAWSQIFKVACEIRNAEPPKATSGPEYFGFTQPTIAYLIEQLPNSNLCKNYQRQQFEISSRSVKKSNYTPRSKKKEIGINDLNETVDLRSDMMQGDVLRGPHDSFSSQPDFSLNSFVKIPPRNSQI